MKRSATSLVVAAVTASLCVVSACSSSKSSTAPSVASAGHSGSSSLSTSTALGTPDAATGSPVKIGYVTTGDETGIDSKPEEAAVAAAVKYVNSYLGGLAGHTLQIDKCYDHGTPAGVSQCTNQLSADKVPTVISVQEALSGYGKSLHEAGINYVTDLPSPDPALSNQEGTFGFQNIAAEAGAGLINVAKKIPTTNVGIMAIDAGGYVAGLKATLPQVYKASGLDLNIEALPPTAANLTPQATAVLQKKPGLIFIAGTPALIISAISGLRQANYKGKTIILQQGIDANTNKNLPGGLNGISVLGQATTSQTDPDGAKYATAMAQYASGIDPSSTGAVYGFRPSSHSPRR